MLLNNRTGLPWRRLLIAGTLAACCAATCAAEGAADATSQQAWQQRYEQAQAAYAAGHLTEAERAARQALALARAGQGQTGPFVASSLNVLALVRQQQGAAQEAQTLLDEALALSEQAQGDHANTAALALNLARVQESLGGEAARQALQNYERALQIADALPPDDAAAREVRQQALAALSRIYESEGEQAQAKRYNQRLLQEGEGGLAAPLRAEALLRQGQQLQQQGQWQQAQDALLESLHLYEAEYGQDAQELVPVLAALASLHHARSQPDQAVPLHQRAVAILQARAPDSPALAGQLSELALWHAQRSEFAQARRYFTQALELVRRQQNGQPSLAEADLVSSLAQLDAAQDDMDAARQGHQQALALYRALGDSQQAQLGQARTLNYLAGLDYRRRRFAEAEALFLQALALMEQALGSREDERLRPLLQNLEALYMSQGQPEKARPYQQRLRAMQRQS